MRLDPRIYSVLAFAALLGWVFAAIVDPNLWRVFRTFHLEPVFLDAYAITAAGEGHVQGERVALSTWRDPYGREHVYSDWWLHLWPSGLGVAHTAFVAFFFLLAGIGGVVWVAGPRDVLTLGMFVAFWLSPPCLTLLNRANNDLVIYACVSGVIAGLSSASAFGRWAALALGTFAAGLKFYPASLGVLAPLIGSSWKARLSAVAAVAACGLGLATWFLLMPGAWPSSIPDPPASWLNTYGARYLAALLGADRTRDVQLAILVFLLQSLLLASLVRGVAFPDLPRRVHVAFAVGVVLAVSTFLAGGSFDYRVAVATFCLPFLVAMLRLGGRARVVSAGVLACLLVYAWLPFLAESALLLFDAAHVSGIVKRMVFLRALFSWAAVLGLAALGLIWALREGGRFSRKTGLSSVIPGSG